MNNEEIIKLIKFHNDFFTKYEDLIEDKGIVLLAKRYTELFLFELMKDNIKNEVQLESKL